MLLKAGLPGAPRATVNAAAAAAAVVATSAASAASAAAAAAAARVSEVAAARAARRGGFADDDAPAPLARSARSAAPSRTCAAGLHASPLNAPLPLRRPKQLGCPPPRLNRHAEARAAAAALSLSWSWSSSSSSSRFPVPSFSSQHFFSSRSHTRSAAVAHRCLSNSSSFLLLHAQPRALHRHHCKQLPRFVSHLASSHHHHASLAPGLASVHGSSPAASPLKLVFDSPSYWNALRNQHRQTDARDGDADDVGLFGYADLADPVRDFPRAAQHALHCANRLVEIVCAAADSRDHAQLRWTVRRLDRLSDMLCGVLDAAELIQNVHPDPQAVAAANAAHAVLSNFLNQLNTHTKLYQALKLTVSIPSIKTDLSREELRVADLLLADFEKSGIHMPERTRRRFVELNDRILELGHRFSMAAHPSVAEVEIEDASNRLAGVPQSAIKSYNSRGGGGGAAGRYGHPWGRRPRGSAKPKPEDDVAVISMAGSAPFTVLRSARDEHVRKLVYIAMNSGSPEQIQTLEEMLLTRAELAKMLGKKSYAEMALNDKMVKTPETVLSFLNSLAELHKPFAWADVQRLSQVKLAHTNGASGVINAWDRLFYAQFVSPASAPTSNSLDPFHQHMASPTSDSDPLRAYFSVGQTFEGLSQLLTTLYGVSFRPAPLASEKETWHEDVRKLEVIHETEGLIGVVYCDVFRRPKAEDHRAGGADAAAAAAAAAVTAADSVYKLDSAAQFTVRCSRRIDTDNEDGDASPAVVARGSRFARPESVPATTTASTTFMRSSMSEKDVWDPATGKVRRYQLPIVVLVTAFDRVRDERNPSLLSLPEVETLFHEMGHVMHSMLARTDLQHIAGTRCPLDFVEVPSNFLEQFARQPAVLCGFARHHRTGERLPRDLLAARRAAAMTLGSLDLQHQLQMAILDQVYHSDAPGGGGGGARFDSTRALRELQARVNVIPFVDGTAWQVQFSHLFNYGASYYSYFWARRWANRVFDKLFAGQEDAAAGGGSPRLADHHHHHHPDPARWRESGQRVARELLAWGGGRDPFVGLENLGVLDDSDREGRFDATLSDLRLE
ncbi:hypothetical protein DFJ73DRAFT_793900 [Zopfochytrium polystomum]|nr:hypothetical protein DFJ73DRAFT_793900 [Zopfochytrium polystomum]